MKSFQFLARFRYTFKDLLIILSVGVIYFIAAKLGLKLAFLNASATAVWPPTGIALAAFLLFGYRIWPAIFIGAFLTNVTTAGSIATSLGIALGNTTEGLVGAYLVNRFAHGNKAFYRAQDIFIFTLLAALVSTVISATIGVTSLALGGYAQWATYPSVWLTWWLGDASGAIIITPFILLWSSIRRFRWTRSQIGEAVVVLLLLFMVSMAVFGGLFDNIGKSYPLEFLCIPFLVWIAFRFGRRETITATVLLSGVAIWGTLHGFGPFSKISQNESLLLLQAFMGVITVTAMSLAAAVLERDQLRETVRNNERRFRALIEKSLEGISLVDKDGKIIYTSPTTQRLLGYTPAEYLRKNPFTLIHPNDVKMVTDLSAQLFEKPNSTIYLQYRVKHKNGTYRWLDVVGTNLLEDPAVRAIVANFRDITERKIEQEKLAQEKAEDEALLESIGDGIIATDPKGKVILVNTAFEELTGLTKKTVIGRYTSDVLSMQDEEGKTIRESERPLSEALVTGKKITATHYLIRKDTTKFPALIVAAPVVLRGKIIGAIKVFHDITREKEIDRAKTEFVSLASHQLRTPLSTIKWYTELLLRHQSTSLTQNEKKYIRQVYASCERMIELTNALLNVSRLELGTFTVELEQVDLVKLITRVQEEVKPRIVEQKIQMIEKYDKTIPDLHADPKLMTVVLQNLISNAVKYTPENGRITITISFDTKKGFLISVADTGYGIPKAQQGKIFTKLFRADNIKTKDQNGSGLGLYIVKSIIENTKGKIWFESHTKEESLPAGRQGTTFYVSFPPEGMQRK